jgi:DNA-binding LacI/PurR family transcriptional regulator
MASLARYDVEVTRQGIDHLVDQGVEGIVVVAPHEEIARAVDEYTTACPVVVVAARPEIPDDSAARYVCINQGSGAAQATDHLIDLGHTRIWHIAGPEGWFDSSSRRASYVACMERAGLAPVILTAAGWTPSCGYLLGEQVAASVRSGGGPTALFVASDALAIGLFRAVWEAGLRVPDDVSVVGFDDIEAAEYLVPRLTTVHQPFAKVGREALRVLIEQLGRRGGGLPPLASVLEPELIVRDSAVRRV